MAGSSRLNAKSLEALGAARLADLLLTLSEGDAGAKRLATIARSGSFLDDHQRDRLLKDLERQRQAISGPIAEHDPARAVELFWDLLGLYEGLIDRCDDSDAVIRDCFHQSSAALGQVAQKAPGDRKALADQVYAAIVSNGYGQFLGRFFVEAGGEPGPLTSSHATTPHPAEPRGVGDPVGCRR